MKPAVLFARADSVYKTLNCDVWDIERNALNWPGGAPVVAHPPCRSWSNFSMFAKPLPGEKDLALWAVQQARSFGGVVEHPAGSKLWPYLGLPAPGERDSFGFTLLVKQFWWGHRAEKKTKLYIVGCDPKDLPAIPLRLGQASHVVGDVGRAGKGKRPEISKAEREHTPILFAKWLLDLANRVAI